ncbi:MAG: glycosyltransferase family 2 protein [Tildeniella torsiva UHER 1998/13D]|jgi:glycosyltransferase involved in cell wall biosynthesis|nr:glycosyltransferase family 2 protein [Tildeniella torsiva UHER 1998/13D]
MSKSLSWGLVIVTFNREKILPLCLQLAVQQTRKPKEIIVIDASSNWETTWENIQKNTVINHSDIRWIYQHYEVPSITAQRNQGLSLATTDVVFLIDDDSLMFPDCAEAVMQAYEADTQGVISSVAIAESSTAPGDSPIQDAQKEVGYSQKIWHLINNNLAFQWFWKKILMMDIYELWIPYDGDFPHHELPIEIRSINIKSIALCRGCQMTFRRDVIARELFDASLRYYAVAEDLDAINRVTRSGSLVLAEDARLHHYSSGGGRFPRFLVSALSILNQACFLRKHSNNLRRDQFKFYTLSCRRIFGDLIKDGLGRRFSFPQVRGDIYGVLESRNIFQIPDIHELNDIYPELQKKLLDEASSRN